MSEASVIENTPSISEIHLSVRGLVEFLLRNGDIDNRHSGKGAESAMQEGSRIHRMIQKRMGPEYEAEVPLRFSFAAKSYFLTIEGRADGIIHEEHRVTIDEIKGTYRNLDRMLQPDLEHLAQAKCYAYIYGSQNDLKELQVRITYCNMETEEIRYFFENYTIDELEEWFLNLLKEYDKWAEYQCQWKMIRDQSIMDMRFPFEYRPGQKELIGQVYQTILKEKKLFLEAPTGVGKTIATIYPSLAAMGRGYAEKIFYLTAKTITRTVAENTYSLLRENGLRFKSVILTAKEKICFCEKADCNPESCEYAKGHFDRINDALYNVLTREESLTREVIEAYAREYRVCPFELALDVTLFADGIICDYNYLFDPDARLKRFFADGSRKEFLFLIDEAHNLLERGREMYSATILKEKVLALKRSLKQEILEELAKSERKNNVEGQLSLDAEGNLIELTAVTTGGSIGLPLDETLESGSNINPLAGEIEASLEEDELDSLLLGRGKKKRKGGYSKLVKEGYADKMIYHLDRCNKELLNLKRECDGNCVLGSIDVLMTLLERFHGAASEYLEEREDTKLPVREEILDLFFDVSHFLETAELMDENYVKYASVSDDGSFIVKLFCVNPRENLKACMNMGRSSILFSATFLPIQYYKGLLGGDPEDYEVYAESVFDVSKRLLLIAGDVTSKYTRRSREEYERIADYIYKITAAKPGNYMVFCPSYAFLNAVFDVYYECYAGENGPSDYCPECLLQQDGMNETDKENFLAYFESNEKNEGDILIGFCVLGGIFGEGIDLREDSLIGAIIVGTGLPQVCFERELLKEHFNKLCLEGKIRAEDGDGFDYAYRYPGMNKVLQAAGRVIRTDQDRGIIALLDERFCQKNYQKLFPREWSNAVRSMCDGVETYVERFWYS